MHPQKHRVKLEAGSHPPHPPGVSEPSAPVVRRLWGGLAGEGPEKRRPGAVLPWATLQPPILHLPARDVPVHLGAFLVKKGNSAGKQSASPALLFRVGFLVDCSGGRRYGFRNVSDTQRAKPSVAAGSRDGDAEG